jgi:ABC-type polysaccharide/polyol phosphate transport system ATPase subunit
MEQVKNFCDKVIYLKEGRVEYEGEVEEGVKKYERETR